VACRVYRLERPAANAERARHTNDIAMPLARRSRRGRSPCLPYSPCDK